MAAGSALRSGDDLESALPFRGERETSQEVVMGQLRKLNQQLGLRHPSRQIPQNLPDGEPGATHTGLTEADLWVDRNPSEKFHPSIIPG